MPGEFQPLYKILLTKAKSDIAIANHAVEANDQSIDQDSIMFHYQQAAEKLLKALLSWAGVHFEKIHDITRLIECCREANIALAEGAEELETLNPYAVQGRIPPPDFSQKGLFKR
jgi:HEPN domain-containing protein